MNTSSKLALGWTLFTGTHLVMSHPPIRQTLIDKMGRKEFDGVYSAVALAIFVPMCVTYYRYRKAAPLPSNPLVWKPLPTAGAVVNTLGVLTMAQAVSKPSAVMVVQPEDQTTVGTKKNPEVAGLNRITRHGMFLSFALFGIGQSLKYPRRPDLIFWQGFVLLYLIGSWHQDERKKSELPAEYFQKTSLLPFKAIIEGRNSASAAFSEMSVRALVISLLIGAAIRFKVWNRLKRSPGIARAEVNHGKEKF